MKLTMLLHKFACCQRRTIRQNFQGFFLQNHLAPSPSQCQLPHLFLAGRGSVKQLTTPILQKDYQLTPQSRAGRGFSTVEIKARWERRRLLLCFPAMDLDIISGPQRIEYYCRHVRKERAQLKRIHAQIQILNLKKVLCSCCCFSATGVLTISAVCRELSILARES